MATRKLSRLAIAAAAVLAIAGAAPAIAQRGGGSHGGGGGFRGSGGARGGARGYPGAYRGGGYGWRGYGGVGWLGYGLLFSALPLAYDTYYWGGVPYYYADDNYYQWNSTADEYETVQPPAGVVSQAEAAPQAQLYAYPTNGQSTAQQTKDRSDCEQWATAQAGAAPATHANYLKAEAACLTGKGYSVR